MLLRVLPVISNQRINAYVKALASLTGIEKKLTFHAARHTFATTVTLSNGIPIETVSAMLGHKNFRTTQIYAKVVREVKYFLSWDRPYIHLKLLT